MRVNYALFFSLLTRRSRNQKFFVATFQFPDLQLPRLSPVWTEEGAHKGRPYEYFFVHLHKDLRVRNYFLCFSEVGRSGPTRRMDRATPVDSSMSSRTEARLGNPVAPAKRVGIAVRNRGNAVSTLTPITES